MNRPNIKNKKINEGIFGMGFQRPEDSSFDTAQTIGDYASNIAGMASFLPGVGRKARIGLRGLAAAGNIGSAYADHIEGDTEDAVHRSMLGLGWGLGDAILGRRNRLTPRITPLTSPVKTKLPPTEVQVRRLPRIGTTTPRVIITPPNPITNPNRILPSSSTKPIVVSPENKTPTISSPYKGPNPYPPPYSRMDDFEDRYIDPRILSYVQKVNKRKGLPRVGEPKVIVDPFSQSSSRRSRDLDVPETAKIGYVAPNRKEVEYQLSKNRYWGDVHPGYYDALSKVDPGAARAMDYLGGQQRIKSLFASYEPETLNDVLVESMVHFVKKKI